MTPIPEQQRFKIASPLARKILLRIILVSVVFAFVSAFIIALQNHYTAVARTDAILALVRNIHVPAMAEGLWYLDRMGLQAMVRTLVTQPEILYGEVISNDQVFVAYGETVADPVTKHTYALAYPQAPGQPLVPVGEFRLFLDNAPDWTSIQAESLVIFLLKFIEVFCLASIFMYFFYRIFGRHLSDLSVYIQENPFTSGAATTFAYNRPTGPPDELDLIKDVLNAQISTTRRTVQQLSDAMAALSKTSYAVEQSPVLIYITDEQKRISEVNKKFIDLTEYRRGEILGQRPYILTSTKADQSLLVEAFAVAEGGDQGVNELQITSKSGAKIQTESFLAPITDLAGERIGYLGLMQDITDRKRSEEKERLAIEEIRRANTVRSEFLASMSHEIRTPLAGIIGLADLLLLEELPTNAARKVGRIKDVGRSLLVILNDILDLSKIEAGKLQVEMLDFDLFDLVDGVTSIFSETLERKNDLVLRVEIAPEVPQRIHADPTRLRQIMVNLIGNAIKFTPAGRVVIRVSRRMDQVGPRLLFEVVDTGIGIEQDKLSVIFDDFAQADASISRRYKGTGLGLAICRRLVGLLDGEIGVDSTSGQGSRFWFQIPCRDAACVNGQDTATSGKTGTKDAETDANRNRSLKILIAEDMELNQEILVAMLARHGHHTELANDGQIALDRVRNESFDLILMDVRMPNMSGVEATQAIRALEDPGRAAVPIIAVTADVPRERRDEFKAAGMDLVITKPINMSKLSAAIDDVMSADATSPIDQPLEPSA